jgi:hypothetical protein
MTLIAAVMNDATAVFFADALITTKLGIPGINDRLPVFKEQWRPQDIHVADLIRKSHSFGPAGFLLWSGKEKVALRFIQALHDLIGRRPEGASLEDVLLEFVDEELEYILTVNHPDGTIDVLSKGCSELDYPGLGKIYVGGSGAGEFLGLISPNENGDYVHSFMRDAFEEGDHFTELLAFAHMVDAKVTAILSLFGEPLNNKWGGALDTFIQTPNGVEPLQYPLYTFSKWLGGGKIAPFRNLVTKEVKGNSLIIGIWRSGIDPSNIKHYLIRDVTLSWEHAKQDASASPPTAATFAQQTDIVVFDPDENTKGRLAYFPRTSNVFRKAFITNIRAELRRKILQQAAEELQSALPNSA